MIKSFPRIMVFIPAYRCEAQITRVLDQFDDQVQRFVDTVVVVDNRSPDDTLQAAVEKGRTRIRQSRFVGWINDDNYGLGGSHKAAFRYAVEQGFDYIIVLHGDDQADIRDLIPHIESKAYEDVDCMLGSRFMRGSRLLGYSRLRIFGNRFYNKLFSAVVARNISDLGSGLNMYRVATYRDFYYKKFPDNLTFNYVMLLASFNFRQNINFFPISWREEDQRSNVKLLSQALKVLSLLSGFALGRRSFLQKEMRAKPFERYSGTIVFDSAEKEK